MLSEKDNVYTCTRAVKKGELLETAGGSLAALGDIPAFHKIAGAFIGAGEKVYKYGEPIGTAAGDIFPGEHVHIHNLESSRARGGRKGD